MNIRPLLSLVVAAGLFAVGCNGSETTPPPSPPPAKAPGQSPHGTGMPPGHPPIDMSSQALPPGATADASVPQWTVPKDWKPGAPGSTRKGSFAVTGADGQTLDIAVTAFPGDVGGALANINRWRGQLGLGPIGPDEVAGISSPIEANGINGTLVDLKADPKRMLVATLPHDGNSWFFKMTGNAVLVEAQKTNFVEFVKSVKF